MKHYIYVEDFTSTLRDISTEDFGADKAKAISKAESLFNRICDANVKTADSVQLWECVMTDEELQAIEEGTTEKWYGDYCMDITIDFLKREWYAIQVDDDDDCSYGSYDYSEAVKMLKASDRYTQIAVCVNGVCERVISREEA